MGLARALARLALVGVLVSALLAQDVDAQRKRKRKSADKASNFFSGATPSGSTQWKSDSLGSIYTVVDTSHLKFDRMPKYYCTVVLDSRKSFMLNTNQTLDESYEASTLANVTGKNVPVRASNSGFRVRLRYKPETGKNLTESVARLGGWRVRWVAITEGHELVDAAREEVINEKYDSGIDEKPVGQSLGYVKMLDALAKEDAAMVQGVLGLDFELPLSKKPKPAPKKPKAEKKKKKKGDGEGEEGDASATTEEEGADATTEEGEGKEDAAEGDDKEKEEEEDAAAEEPEQAEA